MRSLAMFAKVAQRGSYRQAAADLGVSPQAVSKALAALEKELGVWLFQRNTRRLSLTEDGRRLLPLAQSALEGLQAFFDAARADADEGPTGPVRVAAPLALGGEVVTPMLADLQRRQPGLQPDLVLQDSRSDIVAERIDLAVRIGQPEDSRLVVRALSPLQLLVCASPDYLARHGAPADWDDLRAHRLTGFRRPTDGKLVAWERPGPDGGVVDEMMPASFIVNEAAAEVAAVLAGAGIGQIGSFNALPHLRAGRLKLLLPHTVTARYQIYLVRPRRDRLPARVRAVHDHLVQAFAAHPDLVLTEAQQAAWAVVPPPPALPPAPGPARARRRTQPA